MNHNYKKAIIVCTDKVSLTYDEDIYYVGVEKGCLALLHNNIVCDLIISDFDSIKPSELEIIKKNAKKIIIEKPEKEAIDGELAIIYVSKLGIKNIDVYLPTNERLDMAFISIFLVTKYNICIFTNNNLIEPLYKKRIKYLSYNFYKCYKYVSIVPITDSKLLLKNLKYSGDNKIIKLKSLSTRGISNELIYNKNAEIKLLKGNCILFFIK